jgi:UbiD family decarboxylase
MRATPQPRSPAPIDLDEYWIAGGLHGSPVPLAKCKTVDLEVPADAEPVLEGELLPIGWTPTKDRSANSAKSRAM